MEHSKHSLVLSTSSIRSLLTLLASPTPTGELSYDFVDPFIVRYANWRTCEPHGRTKSIPLFAMFDSTKFSLVREHSEQRMKNNEQVNCINKILMYSTGIEPVTINLEG